VDYSLMTVGVRVLLSLSPARARPGTGAADVLSTFENIVGTPFVDSLVGDDVTNRISGGGGNDAMAGNGANDALDGGAGTDRADGGAGNDICTTVETRTSCER
jgi:Ca2+-binding RTX toxin-like protein